MKQVLISLLATHAPAAVVEELDHKQAMALKERWRAIYARETKTKIGRWVRSGFHWHTFSFGDQPAVSGVEAIERYRSQSDTDLLLLGDQNDFALRVHGVRPLVWNAPPLSTNVDLLIVPGDLRWTMAFTHEQTSGLGPYYSEHDWSSK